jgi:hypothetical protein
MSSEDQDMFEGGEDSYLDYDSFDGGAARKKKAGKRGKKTRGGSEDHPQSSMHHVIKGVLIVLAVIAVLILIVWFLRAVGVVGTDSFVGSGINVGGSCCKTYHTPSLTEIEYPASDGCGTCNSSCNLRYDVQSSEGEGFVSQLGSFGAQPQRSCDTPTVNVTGCNAGQLGAYEFSENVLARSLLNGESM